jgi:hypothetical protein
MNSNVFWRTYAAAAAPPLITLDGRAFWVSTGRETTRMTGRHVWMDDDDGLCAGARCVALAGSRNLRRFKLS